MAVFYLNNCSYQDCDKTFSTLSDLIYHIEAEHIDFDPAVMEHMEQQKPQCVRLSYVLRFSPNYKEPVPVAKENVVVLKKRLIPNKLPKEKGKDKKVTENGEEPIRIQRIELHTVKLEKEPLLVESEVSDDSWNDEYNSENLVHYIKTNQEHSSRSKKDSLKTKKFVCPIPGCNKKYKNINGIKYHTKNCHDLSKSIPINGKKVYTCHCGKTYKTAQGMKAHCVVHKKLSITKGQSVLSGPKIHGINHLVRHDSSSALLNAEEEDVLNYAYLDQVPMLSDTVDYNSNNMNLLASPCSYNNHALSDNFADNLTLDDSSNSNSYSFAFAYRKF